MQQVCRSLVRALGVLTVMLLLGNGDVWGQDKKTTISVKVTKIASYKDVAHTFKNRFRYKFEINSEIKAIFKRKVAEDDLPDSVYLNENYSQVIDYNDGDHFKVRVFGWEENCNDDDEFNQSFGSCGTGATDKKIDDIYEDIRYKRKAPEVWHKHDVVSTGRFKVSIEYKWSAPKPPKPEWPSNKICRGENEVQFTVPNHNEKKYSVRWDWQRVEFKESCFLGKCRDIPVAIDNKTFEDVGSEFKYSISSNGTEIVRYRQWYSNTDTL